MQKKILIIDDDVRITYAIQTILRDIGHVVEAQNTALGGLNEALANVYDLVLVDLRMPGKNGAEVVEEILAARPAATVLIITGFPGDPIVHRAPAAGAKSVLRKPFEIGKLIEYLGVR